MSDTQQRIDDLVKSSEVLLFMKGNASFPMCGFSGRAVQILKACGVDPKQLKTVNVLEDDAIRQGIKEYSNWPTIPQLYVKGEFVGGSDIMMEMYESGELQKVINSSSNLTNSWPVEFVILEVFGALNGGLQGQAALGDLVERHPRRHGDRPCHCSSAAAGFGRRIGLGTGLPAAVDKGIKLVGGGEDKHPAKIFNAQAKAKAARNHLHVSVFPSLVVVRHARSASSRQQDQVDAHIAEHRIPCGVLHRLLRLWVKLVQAGQGLAPHLVDFGTLFSSSFCQGGIGQEQAQ